MSKQTSNSILGLSGIPPISKSTITHHLHDNNYKRKESNSGNKHIQDEMPHFLKEIWEDMSPEERQAQFMYDLPRSSSSPPNPLPSSSSSGSTSGINHVRDEMPDFLKEIWDSMTPEERQAQYIHDSPQSSSTTTTAFATAHRNTSPFAWTDSSKDWMMTYPDEEDELSIQDGINPQNPILKATQSILNPLWNLASLLNPAKLAFQSDKPNSRSKASLHSDEAQSSQGSTFTPQSSPTRSSSSSDTSSYRLVTPPTGTPPSLSDPLLVNQPYVEEELQSMVMDLTRDINLNDHKRNLMKDRIDGYDGFDDLPLWRDERGAKRGVKLSAEGGKRRWAMWKEV